MAPSTSAMTTWASVRMLNDAKNSGPDLYPIVKTNRLKRMTRSSGGKVKLPSCPIRTDTIRMQAVVPIAKPWILTRPRMVPIATASSRKISGAVEVIHLTVSIFVFPGFASGCELNTGTAWRLDQNQSYLGAAGRRLDPDQGSSPEGEQDPKANL